MASPLPATEITALLGQGTRFEGKLHFEGRVRVDGQFKGEISSRDVLVIGEGADVEGEIDVASVIVKGGVVRANVRATHSIELYVPAIVSGSLHAPEIFMDKGVQFSGTCTMAPLDAPAGVAGAPGAETRTAVSGSVK
jgi:cytoskeletal protein CcmA (bactofilin family)